MKHLKKFAICDNPNLFKTPIMQGVKDYVLDYKLVIVRAAFCVIKETNDIDRKVVVNELMDFICNARDYLNNLGENKTDYLYREKFLDIYTFYKKQKPGALLIDRSNGCYPLVAYPDDPVNQEQGDRVAGINMAFIDLCKCFQSVALIYDENFEEVDVWTKIKEKLATSIFTNADK